MLQTLQSAGRSTHGFIRRRRLAAVGGALIVVLVIAAAGAELIATQSPDVQNLGRRLEGPSSEHWLGTDPLGRDIFSRIVYGSRVVLAIGFGAVLLSTVIATMVGVASGYLGGWVDIGIQRVVDVWMSLPGLVFLITVLGVIGTGMLPMILAIGLLSAARSARLVRSGVLSVASMTYVEAAQSVGCSSFRIMIRHILPNVSHLIILSATLSLGSVILIEATLSFLGFGIPPPNSSWGAMLSMEGREFMRRAPGLAIWPGIAIVLAVFAFNVFGDGLRDALDPRLRG